MRRALGCVWLACVAVAAAKGELYQDKLPHSRKGNPWKDKGARADDFGERGPRELANNKAFFKEREASRKASLRGAHDKATNKRRHDKAAKAASSSAAKARRKLTKPSKRNHHHHHEQ